MSLFWKFFFISAILSLSIVIGKLIDEEEINFLHLFFLCSESANCQQSDDEASAELMDNTETVVMSVTLTILAIIFITGLILIGIFISGPCNTCCPIA